MILTEIPLAHEVLQELLIGQQVSKQGMLYIHPLVCWKEIAVMMCFFVATWQVSLCVWVSSEKERNEEEEGEQKKEFTIAAS